MSASRYPLIDWRHGPWIGGAIVAGGIAAMHYTGMAAFEVGGIVIWDPVLVAASILLGAVIGAIALPVGLHSDREAWKIGGALLLTLAICGHHFTAMGAASIIPDPSITVSQTALPAEWLAFGVAIASLAILGMAAAAVVIDIRDQRRSELETDRMRELADASVEGLLVCNGQTIVSANKSFSQLVGIPADSLVGGTLENCFPDSIARFKLMSQPNHGIETELRHRDGSMTPVELIMRPIVFAERPHHVIAVRDLKARKDAEQHIHFLAHHDALTGLPNRSFFNARVDQEIAALEPGKSLGILCLDLDRFKEINDLFGHATGDRTLQVVASRIGALLDDRQMMARLGGDEFAILVPGIAGPAAAGRLAESILEALRESPMRRKSRSPPASASRSARTMRPIVNRCSITPTSRSTGRSRKAATPIASSRPRWAPRCATAVCSNTICGRRLPTTNCGWPTSRSSISVAARSSVSRRCCAGRTRPVAKYRPASSSRSRKKSAPSCRSATGCCGRPAARRRRWKTPLKVAVNVSAVQLHTATFAKDLHQILIETGLPGKRLEIEITETALVRDLNRTLATLRQVKALGVEIAMDDFGTGYSSLSNLRAFPFDRIKIDRSFIKSVHSNQQAATIVRAVLGLGKGLGLPVIAEGVETNEELRFLQEESCDEVQGYLLGKPAAIGIFRQYTHLDTSMPEAAPRRAASA